MSWFALTGELDCGVFAPAQLTLANAADTVPAHTTNEGRWPRAVHVSTVFISYRRDDTAPYAGRLYDRLTAHFGAGQVFMDIDQIEPGEDFVEVIQRKVSACEIAIVLIGRHWLNSQDAEGRRRLDDPEDFVRLEVAASLERKVRVVPVLVGGAAMPRMRDLPEAIATLARRNAIEISDARFHSDCDRLLESLARKPSATAVPPDDTKGEETQTSSAQNREMHADATPPRPAAGRSAGGKGWAIAAAATLGVAVLAFIGLRGTNSKPPAAPVTQAPPVLEAPLTKTGDDRVMPSAMVPAPQGRTIEQAQGDLPVGRSDPIEVFAFTATKSSLPSVAAVFSSPEQDHASMLTYLQAAGIRVAPESSPRSASSFTSVPAVMYAFTEDEAVARALAGRLTSLTNRRFVVLKRPHGLGPERVQGKVVVYNF